MKTLASLLGLGVLIVGPALTGSSAQAPAEWRDDLAEHMIGTWKLNGQIMGRDTHHEVQAEWVLNHQFVRIHEKTDSGAPPSERR